jgi:ABC-type nitrate/sulfonate/bicarbonate transport system permease component
MKFKSQICSMLGLAVVLAVWATYSAFNASSFLPSPWGSAVAAWTLIMNGTLLQDASISVGRVLVGYTFGLVLGVALGLIVGLFWTARHTIYYVFELLRPIPTIAWLPIAVLWFGVSATSIIFVVFTGAFFPVFVSTVRGILQSDPVLIRCARGLGASRWQVVRDVMLPSAFPDILSGQRIGLSMAFIYMVAAELIGAQSGLGYMIMQARTLGQFDQIPVGLLTIGMLNLTFNTGQKQMERVLTRWHAGLETDEAG